MTQKACTRAASMKAWTGKMWWISYHGALRGSMPARSKTASSAWLVEESSARE